MSSTQKPEAVFRPDDNEHLGFVLSVGGAWQAQTIFGYDIATLATRDDAVREVMKNGLQILTKIWQYYDSSDGEWYPCLLKEVRTDKVVVIRVNQLGYQDSEISILYSITRPDATSLVAPI